MDFKVAFVTNSRNNFTGSYRIWINDLCQYINEINDSGIKAEICNPDSDLGDFDAIICGKGETHLVIEMKQQYPNKKIGTINLSADTKNLPVDFVIVGSLEEKDSLSHYRNVFVFPLIENMFRHCEAKKHSEKEQVRIGFHGHYPHLSKFEPHLKEALESIDKRHSIELYIITSNPRFNWAHGKPNIKNIRLKSWDLSSVKDRLMSCDIGIVPNVTSMSKGIKEYGTSVELGLYDTDYVMRMKNKSNAGRAFVFHQLGIPVVADFTPSNFHIMGDPSCGYIAQNKLGWEKAIVELLDPIKRATVAQNAKKEFDRLYDPIDWAQRLIKEITEIK